jgi:predicted nucleic acid-binding protein
VPAGEPPVIVVDASILANALADDGDDGGRARAELHLATADGVSAPDLVDVETVAVLRKRWLARTITDRRFAAAIDDLADLALYRYPTLPLMRRAFELRANVTAYDAAYVALAEGLDCALLTADTRLARATGPQCAIRLLVGA